MECDASAYPLITQTLNHPACVAPNPAPCKIHYLANSYPVRNNQKRLLFPWETLQHENLHRHYNMPFNFLDALIYIYLINTVFVFTIHLYVSVYEFKWENSWRQVAAGPRERKRGT